MSGAPASLPHQVGAVGALAFLLVVTAGWWALALWPVPSDAPEWLGRARWVCFNARIDGLPDASGWILLIGQPLGMTAVLMAIWGNALRDGVSSLLQSGWGKGLVVASACCVLVGVGAAGVRVAAQSAAQVVVMPPDDLPPDTYPRLDRVAPGLPLIDQTGSEFSLAALHGQPILVTFAFGNCHTVCPLLVKQTLEVQERARALAAAGELPASEVPRVVIVSLDPWRDTPSRLAHLAKHWDLAEGGYVLSGDVEQVESALDAWNVARRRNPETGDVVHPPLVYILDESGTIVYASSGGVESMLVLLGRV